MSKKIIVPLPNIRWQLHDLFHEYLDEQYELEKTHRYYGGSDEYDYMDDDEVRWLMQQGFVFQGLNDDGCFYDDDDDEDEDVIWPVVKKGKKEKTAYEQFWETEEKKAKMKHRKRGKKGKNARIIDINTPYSGHEENPTEYGYDDLDSDGINDGKLIYYYPNYRNKEDRLEFNTLKEFDDFCADYGYTVPPYVGEQIAYRRVSHVCLNPTVREYGMFEIMAEESYADMMYEAVDVEDL